MHALQVALVHGGCKWGNALVVGPHQLGQHILVVIVYVLMFIALEPSLQCLLGWQVNAHLLADVEIARPHDNQPKQTLGTRVEAVEQPDAAVHNERRQCNEQWTGCSNMMRGSGVPRGGGTLPNNKPEQFE